MAHEERPRTYAEAGVSTQFLNALKDWAKRYGESTRTGYVREEDGSLTLDDDLISEDFPHARWFVETDGIGEKEGLLLKHDQHFTAGWDLVAANVNDIIRHGATPLGMTIDVKIGPISVGETQFIEFMDGVALALKASNCALIGGETAIHRSIPHNNWHLSGTAVGVAQEGKEMKRIKVNEGDVILGLASSGIHTNGATFAIDYLNDNEQRALLAASKIYVKPVLDLLASGVEVHGMAHVSGEGLPRRIPEILPIGLAAIVEKSSWTRPTIFNWIQESGNVPEETMFNIFNMGIGYVIVLPENQVEMAKTILGRTENVVEMGHIEANSERNFVLV